MLRALRTLILGILAGLCLAGGAAWAADAGQNGGSSVLVLLKMPAAHFQAGSSYADSYGEGAQRAARQRIANRLAREHGLKIETGWPMPLVGLDCFVLRAPAGQSAKAVAEELSHDREVAWAEPMQT